MTTRIDRFNKQYSFLSNFHPVIIEYDDITYPSVEHYFQAMKTFDRTQKIRIAQCKSAGKAKKQGRKLKLRPDWDNTKDAFMLYGVKKKFSIPYLARLLKLTGDASLIEGNTWGDQYWGVCNNRGLNKLGEILMNVRDAIPNNILR